MYKFLLFLLLTSCVDLLDTWDGYVIEKGEHKSKLAEDYLNAPINENRLIFKARFLDGMYYSPAYEDLNKLYGFCDCNSTVHQNSARFAWRHNGKGVVEIYTYVYADGKREFKKIGETYHNTVNEYEIIAKGDKYVFKFDDKIIEHQRTKNCKHGLRIRLYPYFGGNNPAPERQLIHIYEKR